MGKHFVDEAMISEAFKYGEERRKPEQTFAQIEIVSCEHKDWWYAKHIGEQVMAILYIRVCSYTKRRYINDVRAVYLTRTKIRIGRNISPKDIVIL